MIFQVSPLDASSISGLAPSATIDTTNASNISSGTLPNARLPNPTTSLLGGVEAVLAVSHQWIDSISTLGIPHLSQPVLSDITGIDALPSDATKYLDGTGHFTVPAGGGGGTPGGSANDVQYNAAGSFGGITLTNGQLVVGQTGSAPLAKTVSGDATLAASGALTVTKTSGSSFAASATTDTTNAANISSGTLPAARLPNPSSSTLGGVQSAAAVSHQFLTSISTSGVPALAQPAASDISGLATSATTDTTNASNIASGTLAAARLPAGCVTIGSVSTAQLDKTSNTNLANVTGLALSLLAGKTYVGRVLMYGTGNGTGGIKVALVTPDTLTATSIAYAAFGLSTGGTILPIGESTNATALATTLASNVTPTIVEIFFTIVVNAAGTLQVQAAQKTSNSTTMSIFVNSSIIATQIT